jgi:hypothetical protein
MTPGSSGRRWRAATAFDPRRDKRGDHGAGPFSPQTAVSVHRAAPGTWPVAWPEAVINPKVVAPVCGAMPGSNANAYHPSRWLVRPVQAANEDKRGRQRCHQTVVRLSGGRRHARVGPRRTTGVSAATIRATKRAVASRSTRRRPSPHRRARLGALKARVRGPPDLGTAAGCCTLAAERLN